MADALVAATSDVLAANAEDVRAAEQAGTSAALVDRLRLDAGRVEAMAAGLREVAGLADPVGEVVRGSTWPTGSSCARSGCRSAWSGSSTRRAPT